MNEPIELEINSESRVPKYQQIINSIIRDIEFGNLKVGQKIPSINEISEEYYLSRDTVEKAYKQLKEKKIIVSAKGKGYYVARTLPQSGIKVLFLLNKLSSYKMMIYNSFINSMDNDARIDLKIYHCDEKLFRNIMEENMGAYDYYVIMPHFIDKDDGHRNYTPDAIKILKQIPVDKLLLLDNNIDDLLLEFAAVYQDFKHDIYEALKEGMSALKKYAKLILIFPKKVVYPYPTEILQGFRMFCVENDFDFEILDEVYSEMELHERDAFIVIEENDLVNLVKQIRDSNFKLGKDIGLISYNDTPLKDLLGITCVSTNFKLMGETAAYMIKKKKVEKVKNAFGLIYRDSL